MSDSKYLRMRNLMFFKVLLFVFYAIKNMLFEVIHLFAGVSQKICARYPNLAGKSIRYFL